MIYAEDVKPVRFSFQCPKCLIGDLVHDDTDKKSTFLTQTKAIFMHKCSNPDCDEKANFERSFPYIEWVSVHEDLTYKFQEGDIVQK